MNDKLSLKQLKERNGKPVYMKFRPDKSYGNITKSQWVIIRISHNTYASCYDGLVFVDMCIKGGICDFYDYEPTDNN